MKKKHQEQGYPDGMPMYCPTCMIERPSFHKHAKDERGNDALEIFCPDNHFVTRFLRDESSKTGWRLDMSAYRARG